MINLASMMILTSSNPQIKSILSSLLNTISFNPNSTSLTDKKLFKSLALIIFHIISIAHINYFTSTLRKFLVLFLTIESMLKLLILA
jgi:hypothetical protein